MFFLSLLTKYNKTMQTIVMFFDAKSMCLIYMLMPFSTFEGYP